MLNRSETYKYLRQRWWIVPAAVLISTATSLVVTVRQSPVYRATTTQVVTPNSRLESNEHILRSIDTLERRSVVATFARIPGTREAREKAAAVMGIDLQTLAPYTIRCAVLPSTNLLQVDVEGPDPERAAELANVVADVVQQDGREMYRVYKIDTLARAVPPLGPIHPDPRRNLLAGGVVGAFIGVLAALGAGYVASPKPRDSRDAVAAVESRSYGN